MSLHSKFFPLLQALKPDEFHGFQKHVRQIHHKDATALKVFEYFRKLYPAFDQPEKLDFSNAYHKIFKKPPDKKNDAQRRKMLDTLSDLHLRLKDFLIAERLRKDPVAKQILWLQVLQIHELQHDFERESTYYYQKRGRQPASKTADFMETWIANYFQREQLCLNQKKPDIAAIRQCTAKMNECWNAVHLKMTCEMNYLQQSKSRGLVPESVSPAFRVIQSPETLQVIYQELIHLSETGEDIHFSNIEALLSSKGEMIAHDELNEILMFLQNHFAPLIRNDQEILASQKLHPLNVIGLKLGVFTHHGIIQPLAFLNIVSTACMVPDTEWAALFVKNHSRFLSGSARRDTILLSEAIIDFSKEQYRNVLQKIESHSFQQFPDELRAKCLVLRAYYELPDQREKIDDFSDAFLDKLRKRSPSEPIKATSTFVQIVKLLNGQRTSKKLLYQRIEQKKQIYFRNWLRLKTEQYEQKHATRRRTGF